jgi:hypothetical protein
MGVVARSLAAALLPLAGVFAVARAATPEVYVNAAVIEVREAGDRRVGRIEIEGTLRGLAFHPGDFVGVDVGGMASWLNLTRPPGTRNVVSTESHEHRHAMAIDLTRGRFHIEQDGILPDTPLRLRLRHRSFAACAVIHFTRAGARWTFDHRRNAQSSCASSSRDR